MRTKTGKSNIEIVRSYLNNERPFTQVGFVGDKHKYRKNGERWKDNNNIEWEKKDNSKVKVTKTPLGTLDPGDGIGINSTGFFSKTGQRTATVTAISSVHLLALDLKMP